jgi:hypothetical protein
MERMVRTPIRDKPFAAMLARAAKPLQESIAHFTRMYANSDEQRTGDGGHIAFRQTGHIRGQHVRSAARRAITERPRGSLRARPVGP